MEPKILTPAASCCVKFCGGCNPRYDRRQAYEAIKERLAGEVRFEFAEDGKRCDMLLYMAGCMSRCTDLRGYEAARGIVTVWEEEQICAAVPEIRRRMNA
ncbi:MAG: hypothetical protein LBT26_05810 [Clostridiales Family XIII bacterium]|jgi:hypothetical protein|nr:hypothetical protein [Clostridiales Family XIII bacterium]